MFARQSLYGSIPTEAILGLSIGGMYGVFFKKFPPSFYVSFFLVLNLLIPFFVSLVFIKKTDIVERLPTPIPGQEMILISGFVIIIPQFLRIFTSMIQGGGASFALMSIAGPFVVLAKLLLSVGIFKLLMATKPHESYVYKK